MYKKKLVFSLVFLFFSNGMSTVFNNYAVPSNTKNLTRQADSFAINNRLYSPILIVACLLITSGVKGLSSSTFYTKHTNLIQDI